MLRILVKSDLDDQKIRHKLPKNNVSALIKSSLRQYPVAKFIVPDWRIVDSGWLYPPVRDYEFGYNYQNHCIPLSSSKRCRRQKEAL